ncbi:PQQ enzyme repeat domain protein [Verrucomicrobiia bacterium DG1235]|nr:PQQ enzyme repeat domain protein [Verrucomicrobiae bacterium DG1235]
MLLITLGGIAVALGETGDEVWSFQTVGSIFGAPAVGADGAVYVGSRDSKVYAVNPDGTQKWVFETGDWVDSSPTLSHDESAVYVGSWDDKMYAVSTVNGAKLWDFQTGNLIVSSPALDASGNLYFGSSDGFFYSVDPSGVLRWSFYVGAELDSSPAVSESGNIHVGGYDGVLYSFSEDGDLLWEFATRTTEDPEDQRIAGAISIGDDNEVYFGGGDGYCYAVDEDGDLIWEFEAYGKVDTGVVLGNDGEVIFASRSGYVYAVDAFGVLLWESFVGDVFYSTPAVDDEGRVYVGSYLGNGVSGINVLDDTGEIVWEYLVLDYIDSSPVIDQLGRLLFGCYDGALYALEANAEPAQSGWNRFGGDRGNRSLREPYEVAVLSQRFGEWVKATGLLGVFADPCFDEDADGFELAIEYLLGTNPQVADWTGLRVGDELFAGEERIYVEHELIVGDAEISYAIEYSTNGALWQSVLDMSGVSSLVVDGDAFGDGWYETRRHYLPSEMLDSILVRIRMGCD